MSKFAENYDKAKEGSANFLLDKYVFRGYVTEACIKSYQEQGIIVEPGWKYGSLSFGRADDKVWVSITEGDYTYAVEPESVGQWTGLYDESTPPKRIFDDDIVKISYTEHYLQDWKETYGYAPEEPVRFDTVHYETDVAAVRFWWTLRWVIDLLKADHVKIEVVGALYDNKEITELDNYHGKRL